eukprot:TRINITY_DN1506_c0_g1_i2.p1 TRINITY_DN1506_c0_g1~~TRINITY_DN1506_c0_g1_i2.p1  ORF type:complete len:588 (-),score=99.97 TRINITY_DN1506_c0_g1_i2:51-1814(-)
MEFSEIFDLILREFKDEKALGCSKDLLSAIRRTAMGMSEFSQIGKPSRREEGPLSGQTTGELRDIGNRHFKEKNYIESLKSFTTLIFHSSVGPRDDDITGFWNRSLALEKLEKYRECLEDLEAFLVLEGRKSVPLFQVYDRRGQCYLRLSNKEEALSSFKIAREHLEKTDLPDKLKDIHLSNLEQNSCEAERLIPHREASEPNARNTLSPRVETRFSPELGRYLVATGPFRPGEVILSQAPIAVVGSDSEDMKNNCHHCLRQLELAPFPSRYVLGISFCTYKCFCEAHRSYHSLEALLMYSDGEKNKKSDVPPNILLALRLVIKLKMFLLGSEDNEDISILKRLVSHEELHDREIILQAGIRTIILGQVLAESGFYDEITSETARDEIEHFIYFLQLALPHNIHSIYRLNDRGCDEILLDKLGRGIYESALYLNHSCSANTLRFNRGQELILIANRSIKAGDRISDCYGSHHFSSLLETRLRNLHLNYKFHCTCEACNGEYLSLRDLMAQEPSLPPKEGKALGKLLKKYQENYKHQNYIKAIASSQKYIEELEKHRNYPHQNYEIGAVALKSSFWNMFHHEKRGSHG